MGGDRRNEAHRFYPLITLYNLSSNTPKSKEMAMQPNTSMLFKFYFLHKRKSNEVERKREIMVQN